MLVGAAVFGDAWFERADPFEVYSTLLGRLCPIGRRERRPAGACAVRWPTSTASTVAPGLVAVVAVLFGTTAFDSYKDTISWRRLRRPAVAASTRS